MCYTFTSHTFYTQACNLAHADMVLRSAFDTAFLGQVEDWIATKGEVFVVIRYAHQGGSKDFLFVTSYEQFRSLLDTLPPRADVIVFRDEQLPIRGIADDDLCNLALAAIPDGEWWLLICLERDRWGHFTPEGNDSHQALKSVFEEYKGKRVAVGLDPPYHRRDNPGMQSGVIPMPDGSVLGGAY